MSSVTGEHRLMGWLWLGLFGACAMALLAVLGVGRALWSFAGAALMLGATGYALQGSPTLAGKSADPRDLAGPDEPDMITLRDDMLGRFTLDGAYLIAADAMTARGDDRSAVRVLLGGIAKIPDSYALWTALGTAYARHDGGQVSPAARFAFDQARRIVPQAAAPAFFEGLAYARAGDLDATRRYWIKALALTPARVSYRRDIALRLVLLDRFIAMQRSAPVPR